MKTIEQPLRQGSILLVGLLLIPAISAWGASTNAASSLPARGRAVVHTEQGPVAGVKTATMREFLGIPYAAPPVGRLRWKPPQPPRHRRGLLDATTFANHCPQTASPFGQISTTEDCLYLNVFAPRQHGHSHNPHAGPPAGLAHHAPPGRGNGRNRYPVMVWMHGGSLVIGESDDYHPAPLVNQGVVVVTINYRLGILGFLAHPALTAESPSHASGDYGLMDQQAALEWVKRNIARFGGDPHNVTLFGESAGGLSVLAQLVSPTSTDLFQKAIVESGSYSLSQPSLSQAQAQGSAFAQRVGCSDQSAHCLRSLSVGQILQEQGHPIRGFVPNTGTRVLPRSIVTGLSTGQFKQVPIIEGTNRNEWRFFVALEQDLASGPLQPAQYQPAIAATLGVSPVTAQRVAAQYPLSDYASPDLALSAVGTDAIFACNGLAEVGLLSQHVPTYAYEFNDPNAPELYLPPVSFAYGAPHISEVQYLFDLPQAQPLSGDQRQLSAKMIHYWTRFARTGNPNSPSGSSTFWPAYRASAPRYLSLMPPSPTVTTGFSREHHCGFWHQLQ